MSLSRLAVNPRTKTKYLNMSMDKSFKLNLSYCWFTFPAKLTKSSSSSFLKFKHLYQVWNKLFLSPKILDKNIIASSNEISSGDFGGIKFVYFVFSSVPGFWSNKTSFCLSKQVAHHFEKNGLNSSIKWSILRNYFYNSFCRKKWEFPLFLNICDYFFLIAINSSWKHFWVLSCWTCASART